MEKPLQTGEPGAPIVELRGLRKSYLLGRHGERRVLFDLTYSLASGRFIAIMGDSGVGKSTLLNLIAGLDTPDAGDVLIAGTSILRLGDDAATRLRRKRLGFMFQAFHILPHLNVMQNVALPLLLNRQKTVAARAMLAAVGLEDRGQDFPRQLSGGELQRVAIARALVHRPALVLADEPTGNLDPDTAHVTLQLLRDTIRANGASAIMVTHSQAAAAMADEVFLLTRNGLNRVDQCAG